MPASRMTTTVCEESIPCVSNPGELSSLTVQAYFGAFGAQFRGDFKASK